MGITQSFPPRPPWVEVRAAMLREPALAAMVDLVVEVAVTLRTMEVRLQEPVIMVEVVAPRPPAEVAAAKVWSGLMALGPRVAMAAMVVP